MSREIRKMEPTSTFASANDHGVSERQRVEDIEHVIMTLIEVARRLSKEIEPVDGDIISPKRRCADER